jgi:hypothetical protein
LVFSVFFVRRFSDTVTNSPSLNKRRSHFLWSRKENTKLLSPEGHGYVPESATKQWELNFTKEFNLNGICTM